jgi:hypothetical protein
MTAVITSTGITFGDAGSTVLNSKYGIIAQTNALTFFMASAPTGWTQVTTHNDKTLRVVSGTGAGSGGTTAFSSAFASKTISGSVPVTISGLAGGSTTLDSTMIPAHAHPVNAGGAFYSRPPGTLLAPGSTTGNTGGGLGHSHPITYTSASGPVSTSVNLTVNYVDIIICSFS